jgi:cytidylate kinase
VILAAAEHTLHVRIIAPAELRATRVAQLRNVSQEAALAQVEASDRSRKNYLRRFYKVNWDQPGLYDLVINTARLEPMAAARVIAISLTKPPSERIKDAPLQDELYR